MIKLLERDLQKQVVAWVKVAFNDRVRVVASMNAAARKPHTGKMLILEGMWSGDPDLKIMWGNNQFGHIELKTGKNKPTDSQLEMIEWMRQHNMLVEVCYSLEEVQNVFKKWGIK